MLCSYLNAHSQTCLLSAYLNQTSYVPKGFFHVKGTTGIEQNEVQMVVKDRCAEQDLTAPVAVKEAMALQSTGSGKEKVPDSLVTEQVTSW